MTRNCMNRTFMILSSMTRKHMIRSGIRLVCLLSTLLPSAICSRDLGEVLRFMVPSLMKAHHTPGMQIAIFRPGREFLFSTGNRNLNQGPSALVTDQTLFLAGELTTSLLPLLLEEELSRSSVSWHEAYQGRSAQLALFGRFQEDVQRPGPLLYLRMPGPHGQRSLSGGQIFSGTEADRAFLLSLYNSVSGLPPSRSGISADSLDPESVRQIPRADHVPFSHIAFSSEGMGLLIEYFSRVRDRPIEELLTDTALSSGMSSSIVMGQGRAREGIEAPDSLFARGYIAGDHPAEAVVPWIGSPGIYGLATNARDMSVLIRHLSLLAARGAKDSQAAQEHSERDSPAGQVFGGYFAYARGLGGFSGPFHVRRLCGHLIYEASGSTPGFSSRAVFSGEGKGLVLLSNADDGGLLDLLEERILRDLYPDCIPGEEWSIRQGEWNPRLLAWANGDKAALGDWMNRLDGTFRPEGLMPENRQMFAFLQDLHLRLNENGRLELSGFYDRTPPVILAPTAETGVFEARGLSPMQGWRIRFFDESGRPIGETTADLINGSVAGFYTDGAVFRRVHWLDSIRGRIVITAFGIFLISVLVLRYYVRRRPV